MIDPPGRSLARLLASAAVVAMLVRAEAADPSQPAAPRMTMTIAYSRNALRASVVSGNAAIALTGAGTLLRFGLPDLVLTAEYSGDRPITCVGEQDGSVVAAADDGSVYSVDVERLALKPIGRVTGRPIWVSPTVLVHGVRTVTLVTQRAEHRKRKVNGRSEEYDADVLTVEVLPSGRSDRVQGDVSGIRTFLLAGRRLWIGLDRGEWGGRCGYVDLDDGHQKWFESDGVYGFALVGGRVLALGGSMHMGLAEALVATVGAGAFSVVYKQSNYDPKAPNAEPPSDRPFLPISAVVPDTTPGHLLIFSYDRVFRADANFTSWTDAGRLDLEYATGRPAAVGTLPSIVAVHPLPEGQGFLVATSLNGYVVLRDGKTISKAVAHQPAGAGFDTLVPFGSGVAFVDSREPHSPQYFSGGDWRAFPVFPDSVGEDCWSQGVVTPGGDGSLLMKAVSCRSPGLRVLSRWRDGRSEIIHRWDSDGLDWWRDVLGTPDGAIWNLGSQKISRLAGGQWVPSESVSASDPTGDADGSKNKGDARYLEFVDVIKLVSESGPPWFLLDRRLRRPRIDQRLLKFTYDENLRSARLLAVRLDSADRLEVYDAVALAPSRLLVATSAGLRVFDTGSDTLSAPDFPLPPAEVRRLARDRRGRVWMGGAGLWMLDGHDLIDFGSRMSATGSDVEALAGDPMSDGVVALLERGMALFLDAR